MLSNVSEPDTEMRCRDIHQWASETQREMESIEGTKPTPPKNKKGKVVAILSIGAVLGISVIVWALASMGYLAQLGVAISTH